MNKIDWKAVAKTALRFFVTNILPMLLSSAAGAAAYDQAVSRPAIQAMAAQGCACGCQK